MEGVRPELHYGHVYDDDKYAMLRIEKYGRLIKERVARGSKVLEIGCYTARIMDCLPEGVDYCGMDFDEAALELARARGAKTIQVHMDLEDVRTNETYDAVICTEVLEHLVNPCKMMERIGESLKDDGVVLLSLPNENTIYHRIMSAMGFGVDLCAFQLYKHIHLPTITQSRRFVERYFRVIREEYYINPSAKGSRIEWAGRTLGLIPDAVWTWLSYVAPGLFARGVIFVCEKHAGSSGDVQGEGGKAHFGC